MKFSVACLIALSLTACSPSEQTLVNKAFKATVMITNLAENSGGTGTILKSAKAQSLVLTNSHVCEVVKGGGIVHSVVGKYAVTGFSQSERHDLCLLSVDYDLGVQTEISKYAPQINDKILVSGHPKLMPTTMTFGNVSIKIIVPIVTKVKECTVEDLANPDLTMFCVFVGGIPVVKSYESTPTSALIQPGSSGSGVYNQSGDIVAVIFAGSGDLGFGLTVPYEYVVNFLFHEASDLRIQKPNTETPVNAYAKRKPDLSDSLDKACEHTKSENQEKMCELFKNAADNALLGE